MPNDLTPDRLRALIAAATPGGGPWTMECEAEVSVPGESIDLRLSIRELNQVHRLTREQLEHWDYQTPNSRLLEASSTTPSPRRRPGEGGAAGVVRERCLVS